MAVAAERLAARSEIQFDWTFEGAFELSPATRKALAELPAEVTAMFFYDVGDPRRRRTELLLDRIAAHGPVRVREQNLSADPEAADSEKKKADE